MSLSKEERIEIIFLAGYLWCPHRALFVNKETIFPQLWTHLNHLVYVYIILYY